MLTQPAAYNQTQSSHLSLDIWTATKPILQMGKLSLKAETNWSNITLTHQEHVAGQGLESELLSAMGVECSHSLEADKNKLLCPSPRGASQASITLHGKEEHPAKHGSRLAPVIVWEDLDTRLEKVKVRPSLP